MYLSRYEAVMAGGTLVYSGNMPVFCR